MFMPHAISAAVRAFSLTARITQRDRCAITGRGRPGNCTLPRLGEPGPHRPGPPRRSRAWPPAGGPGPRWMIPGWRPSLARIV